MKDDVTVANLRCPRHSKRGRALAQALHHVMRIALVGMQSAPHSGRRSTRKVMWFNDFAPLIGSAIGLEAVCCQLQALLLALFGFSVLVLVIKGTELTTA